MKSHEEIKKALDICADGKCYECHYYRPTGIKCLYELPADALDYIRQLEAQISELAENGKYGRCV